jgi:hypothetical protein
MPMAGPLVILVLMVVVAYVVSLRRHPYSRCRICDRGKVRGRVFSHPWCRCRAVGGTGRRPRIGTWFFGI